MTPEDREPLLPCPFCGQKAWEYIADNSLVIACPDCGASVSRVLAGSLRWGQEVIACRQAWNRRVNK
jgi:Lar family restriction alleviation protein